MKAVVQNRYGTADVLKLVEVERPVPQDHEVLVQVLAASINGADWEGVRGRPLYARLGGLWKPGNKIPGSDIAGRVVEVGRAVKQFQAGDEVFGETLRYQDGFAEFACAPEKGLARKPAALSFAQAAAIPQAGVIALQGVRDQGQVQPGQKVLINGAGGGAGMFAVQLARLYGAEVTGVDTAAKLDFIRSLGADHVIDYAREDFTHIRNQYDLILDVIAQHSVFDYQRALRINGKSYFVGGSVGVLLQTLLLGPWISKSSGKHIRILMVRPNQADLESITELCTAGKILPFIDRVYPLEKVVDAFHYVGERRALGKVVLTFGREN